MGGVVGIVKSFYYDPFKWSVVKSVGVFALGVTIALELRGVDLSGPVAP